MVRILFDAETGEFLTELEPGDRIVRANSIKNNKARKEKNKKNSFVKINTTEGVLALKELSTIEKALLFSLQFFVSYDGILKKKNGDVLGFNEIISISGLSKNSVSAVIKSLCEKNMIHKEKTGNSIKYYLNPLIFLKGVDVSEESFERFKNYKIKSLGNITWREIKGNEES